MPTQSSATNHVMVAVEVIPEGLTDAEELVWLIETQRADHPWSDQFQYVEIHHESRWVDAVEFTRSIDG